MSRWWEDLVHPDDRALALPARVARAAGADHDADSISCEYRVRHKNGNYVWIWDHCVLVRDRSGVVTRAGRQRARHHRTQGSRSAPRRPASIVSRPRCSPPPASSGRTRRQAARVGEQTSWSAFTGQSSDELAGMGWLEAIHPDDVEATLEAWRRALATQRRARHRASRAPPRWRVPDVLRARGAGHRRARRDHRVGGRAHRHHRAARCRAARARQPAPPGAGARRRQRRHVGLGSRHRRHDLDAPDPSDHRRRAPSSSPAAPSSSSSCCCRTASITRPCSAATFAQAGCGAGNRSCSSQRPDGSRRWIQNRATAIADGRGRRAPHRRHVARRHAPQGAGGRARSAADRRARRAQRAGGGQPGQGRIPRDHLARAAHAAQCHPRLDHVAAAAARRCRHHAPTA